MDPQSGKWIATAMIVAGGLLATVGGILFNHYRDNLSSQSGRVRHEEVVKRFDEADSKADARHNDSASRQDIHHQETVDLLNKLVRQGKGKSLATAAPAHISTAPETADYRPLTDTLRRALVKQMGERVAPMVSQRGLKVRLFLQVYGAPTQSQQSLIEEMRDVLSEAGISTAISGPNMYVGGNVGNPVAIGYHATNEDAASALAEVLQPLIGARLVGTKNEKFDASEILLKISGVPKFRADGSVAIS